MYTYSPFSVILYFVAMLELTNYVEHELHHFLVITIEQYSCIGSTSKYLCSKEFDLTQRGVAFVPHPERQSLNH